VSHAQHPPSPLQEQSAGQAQSAPQLAPEAHMQPVGAAAAAPPQQPVSALHVQVASQVQLSGPAHWPPAQAHAGTDGAVASAAAPH